MAPIELSTSGLHRYDTMLLQNDASSESVLIAPLLTARSTAFTGTNWHDDNKLSSSSRGCHHSCSAHRPTCYLYGV